MPALLEYQDGIRDPDNWNFDSIGSRKPQETNPIKQISIHRTYFIIFSLPWSEMRRNSI